MSIEEIERKITSCSVFADSKCPHQLLMERLYLVPQILTPEQLQEYELLSCPNGCPNHKIEKIPADCALRDAIRAFP